MECGHGMILCRFHWFISITFFHFTYPAVALSNIQVRCQSPAERQEVLTHLESHLADFLADSKESTLFTPGDRRQLEEDAEQAQQHCQKLVVNMETGENWWMHSHLQNRDIFQFF